MKELSSKLAKYASISLMFVFSFSLLFSENIYANTYNFNEKTNIYPIQNSQQIIYQGMSGENLEILSENDEWCNVKLDQFTNGWLRKPTQAKGFYSYPTSGTVLGSHSDASLKVSIEKIGSYHVTKIWCRNPGSQIKKAEAGWGTNLATVASMLSSAPGAIVGCNGSGFYKVGSWHPVADDIALKSTSWNMTTEGYLVISNGVLRRAINGQKCNAILGILPNGSLKYYNTSYSVVSEDKVQNTFAFGPLLVTGGQKIGVGDTRSASRTSIGQMDENNFVIINSHGTLSDLGAFGSRLGCKILYNLDGGGSRTLWFKGNQVLSSTRQVADALYFTTL